MTPAWLKRDGQIEPLDVVWLCPELLDHWYSVSVIAAQHERIEDLMSELAEARHETEVQRARGDRWRDRCQNRIAQ